IRIAVVFVMLFKILDGRNLSVVVVSRDGQDRDVDPGVVFFIRDHVLPVLVISGMLEPALKPRVPYSVNLVDVAIRLSALVPFVIKRARRIGMGGDFGGEVFGVGDVKRPAIVGAQEYVVLHRQALARDRGDVRDDGLRRRVEILRGGPLSESVVAASVHADLSV